MAYTITLTSSAQFVNDTDTMQMILTFTVDLTGTNLAYTFAQKGIRVDDWGASEMSYDLEDALLVPGIYAFTLSDAQGYLDELLFGTSTLGLNTRKNPAIELKLNGSTEYKGIIQEDGLDYDEGTLKCKFSVDPNTAILNKTKLFDESGKALNPFGLPAYGVMPLKDAILRAYRLVNPNLTLNINHNWNFYGVKTTSPFNTLDTISLKDILAFPQNLVFRKYPDVNNVGDFLRKLALDFCAFTGMTDYNTAFFNKLFMYDSANVQAVGMKLSHRRTYWYQLIDFVKVTLDIPDVLTVDYFQPETGGENVYTDEGKLKRQIFTGFQGQYIISPEGVRTPFGKVGTQMQGLISGKGSLDGTYEIWSCKDDSVDGLWRDNGDVMTRFWYNYRHVMPRMRVDLFEFVGLNYSFLKNFNYKGNKYQILRLKKKYSKSSTEIDALHLGVL